MHLTICLLFISFFSPPHIEREVSFYKEHVTSMPLQVCRNEEKVVILDQDLRIWILDKWGNIETVFGGKGQGPGELQSPVTGIQVLQDTIMVFENQGSNIELFDISGRWLDSKKDSGDIIWTDLSRKLQARAPLQIKNGEYLPFSIQTVFTSDGKESELDFPGKDDRVLGSDLIARQRGKYVLVAGTQGVNNLIYYMVLDTLNETSEQGSFPTQIKRDAKKLPKNSTFKTIMGLTTSPEYGFLLTEAGTGKKVYASAYKPESKKWHSFELDLSGLDMEYHGFLVHLETNRWMIWAEDRWVFFQSESKP